MFRCIADTINHGCNHSPVLIRQCAAVLGRRNCNRLNSSALVRLDFVNLFFMALVTFLVPMIFARILLPACDSFNFLISLESYHLDKSEMSTPFNSLIDTEETFLLDLDLGTSGNKRTTTVFKYTTALVNVAHLLRQITTSCLNSACAFWLFVKSSLSFSSSYNGLLCKIV